MMLTILATALLLAMTVDGAAVAGTIAPPGTCRDSFSCGAGMCCRDSSGHVLSSENMGGFGPLFGLDGSQTVGTCNTTKAQKGDICDSSCQCDIGLACYRPMSGVCCPPHRCYDEAYVKQQQAYWQNCMSNPGCALPP